MSVLMIRKQESCHQNDGMGLMCPTFIKGDKLQYINCCTEGLLC